MKILRKLKMRLQTSSKQPGVTHQDRVILQRREIEEFGVPRVGMALTNYKSIPHCKAGPQSHKMKQKTKATIKIHRQKEKDDMKLQVTRKWPGCSYQGRVILLMGCSRKCV